MRSSEYDNVVAVINAHKGEDCTQHLIKAFPRLETAVLCSIYSQEVQKRVKRSYQHYMQPSKMTRIYNKYLNAVERGEGPGILISMARSYNFSPAMLARLVLERYLALNDFPEPAVCSFTPLEPATTAATGGGELAASEGASRSEKTSERQLSEPVSPPPITDEVVGSSSPSEGPEHPRIPTPDTAAERPATQRHSSFGSNTVNLETSASAEPPDTTQRWDDSLRSPTERDEQDGKREEDQPSFASLGPEDDSGALEVGSSASTTVASRRKAEETPMQLTGKPRLNKLFRDTSLIPDKALSFEVHMCLLHDDVYGPFADTIKHSIGHEYEILLCRKLEEQNIGYKTEEDLRVLGCDKTPDVKLDVPIGVDGHVVNWIESKASFGDRESHKQYLKDQFWSYWNRFGPGLVIYWFGYIDELDTLGEKGILLRESFPTDIVQLNPTAAPGS